MNRAPLRIGTRGSRLARWQAEYVRAELQQVGSEQLLELVEITTTGDRFSAASLTNLGGQGLFTLEIQQAVLDGRADMAVHSLKDLPTQTKDGLILAAVLPRGPAEDVIVLPERTAWPEGSSDPLAGLGQGARVATGSLRRRAQLLSWRADLVFVEVRGNVDTRLRKLDGKEFDALVLARAGLERLGCSQRITRVLRPEVMLPAVGQGAVAVECRAEDSETRELLRRIDHPASRLATAAERALLATLRGGCQAPVGALAQWLESRLTLRAVVLSPDGSQRLEATMPSEEWRVSEEPGVDPAQLAAAESLGRHTAQKLLDQGAADLISLARKPISPHQSTEHR